MTCIVGIVSEGKVFMGGDSAGSNGFNITSVKYPKVFKRTVNGYDYLFGYTSSFRMAQIIQYNFSIPEFFPEQEENMSYLVSRFIPSLRGVFKEHGYSEVDNNQEFGGTFLLGFNGELFEIEPSFQVIQHNKPYASVGCGMYYALGCLHGVYSTEEPLFDTEICIIMALQAAQEFSEGVREPFIIESI